MKPLLLLILLTLCSLTSFTQEFDKKTVDEFFQAYGYCRGQQLQLNHIAKTFPELQGNVANVTGLFYPTFGKSCQNLVNLTREIPKESLQKLETKLQNQHNTIAIQTKTKALSFLQAVRRRAKGQLPSPLKENLLWFNPDIIEKPEVEFLRGYTKTYRTKGHPKAKGLDFTLQIPFTWKQREGKRPNIIQFFKPGSPFESSVGVSIMVKKTPLYKGKKLTNTQAKLLFTKKMLAEMSIGETVLESGRIVLEGQPGGYVVTEITAARLDIKVKTRMLLYFIYYDGRFLSMNFGVTGSPNSFNFDEGMKRFRPLFRLIANSLILNDRYEE